MLAASPPSASARAPDLTVPKGDLEAAFHCPTDPTAATKTPIMFVTGTGATGEQGYLVLEDAFEAYGHPICYVNFPDFTTADIQISVQYLVYGLRKEFKLADRRVAVFGISQGALLPRFALTYWPDLRRKIGDVLAVAGAQHGTTADLGCSESSGCLPAYWQQMRGSNLLDAINSQPDETPGEVSYTTVRSLNDELAKPQGGKHPTSSLDGASNILIQGVCPGRETTHTGTMVDSVTFEALIDAVAHHGKAKKGAAKVSRLPADVCDHPYADGLDEAQTSAILDGADEVVEAQEDQAPTVSREPGVRKVFLRSAP
jgi:triacylglycerol lipase